MGPWGIFIHSLFSGIGRNLHYLKDQGSFNSHVFLYLPFRRAWQNDYLTRLALWDLCLQVTTINDTTNKVRAIPTLHINQQGTVESVLSIFAAAHRSDGVNAKAIVLDHLVMMYSIIILNPYKWGVLFLLGGLLRFALQPISKRPFRSSLLKYTTKNVKSKKKNTFRKFLYLG